MDDRTFEVGACLTRYQSCHLRRIPRVTSPCAALPLSAGLLQDLSCPWHVSGLWPGLRLSFSPQTLIDCLA